MTLYNSYHHLSDTECNLVQDLKCLPPPHHHLLAATLLPSSQTYRQSAQISPTPLPLPQAQLQKMQNFLSPLETPIGSKHAVATFVLIFILAASSFKKLMVLKSTATAFPSTFLILAKLLLHKLYSSPYMFIHCPFFLKKNTPQKCSHLASIEQDICEHLPEIPYKPF